MRHPSVCGYHGALMIASPASLGFRDESGLELGRGARRAATLLAIMLCASCDGADPAPEQEPPEDAAAPCAPNRVLPSGACLVTGVPPEACAEGFEADGQQGCNAILPAEPCPPGLMAIPGDTACREVAPCPEAPYGDAPLEPTTQFVDAAYAGDDSDGSMARPWKTINEAVAAAEPTAGIAIAAGTYEEGVWSKGKAVRLWGRCPAMVEIVGTMPGYATVELSQGDGAELHDLSVSGVSFGVYVNTAAGVVLDRVHVHDTGFEGVLASGHLGPAEVSVRRSLVERASSSGVAGEEAIIAVEDSAVRDILDVAANDQGFGIYALLGSRLTVTRSVSSGSWVGIAARGSEATAVGVVVTDTHIAIGNTAAPEGPSTFAVSGSVIERYEQYGAFSDAGLSVSGTVFRDAVFLPDGTIPSAIAFNSGATGSCQDSLVERSGIGLTIRGATASVERLALRDALLPGAVAVDGSVADIRSSTFERTRGVGVLVSESSATLQDIIVVETALRDGLDGDGVAGILASVDITSARIESSTRCGVGSFGSTVRIGGVALECNAIHLDGEVYDGAMFDFDEGQGELTCGCGGEREDKCKVQSSTLAPPSIEGVTD